MTGHWQITAFGTRTQVNADFYVFICENLRVSASKIAVGQDGILSYSRFIFLLEGEPSS